MKTDQQKQLSYKPISAVDFWKNNFDEIPQNDAERLGCAMMRQYSDYCNENYRTEIKFLQDVLDKICRIREAWALPDVLAQLIKATDILLKDHGYDGNSYEEMQWCSEIGKELITEINQVLSTQALTNK